MLLTVSPVPGGDFHSGSPSVLPHPQFLSQALTNTHDTYHRDSDQVSPCTQCFVHTSSCFKLYITKSTFSWFCMPNAGISTLFVMPHFIPGELVFVVLRAQVFNGETKSIENHFTFT